MILAALVLLLAFIEFFFLATDPHQRGWNNHRRNK